jgi:hypothetical protein
MGCAGVPRMHHIIDRTLLTSDSSPQLVRTHGLLRRGQTGMQFARQGPCFSSGTMTTPTPSCCRYFRMMKLWGLLSGSETEQVMQKQTLFYTSPWQPQNSLDKESNAGGSDSRRTAGQISFHCYPWRIWNAYVIETCVFRRKEIAKPGERNLFVMHIMGRRRNSFIHLIFSRANCEMLI